MSSYIIIGDVHGCYDELITLLDRYALDCDSRGNKREIVFVGDLVDKGPKPHRCVELAKMLDAVVVKGNHEDNHIRYRGHERRRIETGKKNPMKRDDEFKKTHRKLISSPLGLIDFMEEFPLFYRIPEHRVVVVHGGLLPGPDGLWLPENVDPKKITRVRNLKPRDDGTFSFANLKESMENPDLPFWTEEYNGRETVVYGHAPVKEVRMDSTPHATCWGIDTGAVYGNKLSALLVPEFDVVSVDCPQYYAQKKYW
ncbi:MAG: hypothetical protein GTO63_21460 [Anaerolineae bacterium]|nr:hypothetical protein [Anaerolineae bacterium]NIQ80274.1 hypothetical protein [Anaerolineae bacterium]